MRTAGGARDRKCGEEKKKGFWREEVDSFLFWCVIVLDRSCDCITLSLVLKVNSETVVWFF